MGIPYLTRHLASLSESILLGKSSKLSCKTVNTVIVDGPGLVHHVYAVLLAQGGTQSCQVERLPSCDDVSTAVMTYLVLLQIAGVNISKIYFDGALPLNKRETRLGRLEAARKQLEKFCVDQRYGFHLPAVGKHPKTFHPNKLLRSHHSPTKRAQLPGNPFMVPAVTEDLRTRWTPSAIISALPTPLASIYKQQDVACQLSSITEIVPGEADVFCAALAAAAASVSPLQPAVVGQQQTGTAILTSDSDLFLFELGPNSSVVLFDTIYAETWNESDPTQLVIKAMQFCPTAISDRLGIPALSYLAHEMDLSPRSTFSELVRRAKNASASSAKTPAYTLFLKEYDLANFQYDQSKGQILQKLDTRVSELLAQCFQNEEFLDEAQSQAPRMYLPFLIEDHSRRCAWTEGARIRRLAYSLIRLNGVLEMKKKTTTTTTKELLVITECVRRGRRFCFDNVALYMEVEDIEIESRRLLDALQFIRQSQSQHQSRQSEDLHQCLSQPLFWRTFALYEIHTDWDTIDNNRSAVAPQDYHSGLNAFLGLEDAASSSSNEGVTINWDNLHAFARLQAVLYSLRMVFQVIQDLELGSDCGSVKNLRDLLVSLPPLHVLMRSFQEVRRELANAQAKIT